MSAPGEVNSLGSASSEAWIVLNVALPVTMFRRFKERWLSSQRKVISRMVDRVHSYG